jgi:hypothetical protein
MCDTARVTDFAGEDLSGARFDDVSLAAAQFHDVTLAGANFSDVDLTNTHFRLVDLTGAVIVGAALRHVQINGDIDDLRINGVDVAPLVEAELDRRHPERALMRPRDADGFRAAWAVLERLWGETVERAQRIPPELLHERVDGEWSFIETLRHLVFATDAWVGRAVLGDPSPWDPLDLSSDEVEVPASVPRNRDVRPSLQEVLVLRADRMATVRRVFDELSDESLAGTTEPVLAPGYPESESFPVRRCLQAVLSEEWAHRLYAERDLEVLAGRGSETGLPSSPPLSG